MNSVLNFDKADSIFNSYKHSTSCDLKNRSLLIRYTDRAKQELEKRKEQLVIEMQIYFSCLVQKRVLFHDSYNHEKVTLNNKLAIALRVVQSDVCNPVDFAVNHPEKQELKNQKAKKMTAKELIFDYKENSWIGNFKIG